MVSPHAQVLTSSCRVDLGWSIKNSSKPDFYDGSISWDSFLDKIRLNQFPPIEILTYPELDAFISTWDPRLQNVFVDLRSFSRMADALIIARQKLQPELFQEIMLSSQYRLLFMENCLNGDPLQESIRLGLLAYESTVFLQAPGLRLESVIFAQQLREAIENFVVVSSETADLKLWLLFIGTIITFDVEESWLCQAIQDITLGQDWTVIRQRLKRVMWIEAIHDSLGRRVYNNLQQALGSTGAPLAMNIPFHSTISIFAS